MNSLIALAMFFTAILALLFGYPVAFTLGAIALLFGMPTLGPEIFALLPMRIFGIMTNFTLLAVPLFVFMGVVLERSGLAKILLENMAQVFGRMKGGLAVSVVLVGALLGATTGVVGATVVTLGVIALPIMMNHRYQPSFATGTIATSGTLGQVIPPSIVLILLADIMGVSVGRLFMGAIIPSAILVLLYILYILSYSALNPKKVPRMPNNGPIRWRSLIASTVPPLFLMIVVLGSIIFGVASPTESAALGSIGAILLAISNKNLTFLALLESATFTIKLTSMVFMILVGATAFSLVFKGLGGDSMIRDSLAGLESGKVVFLFLSMLLIFLMGFFLDFIEISFIVVPILMPICNFLGIDPLWFGIMIAVNLQTSFLTPPFGFSIFYLKAVAPKTITTVDIYKGVVPFIGIQIFTMIVLVLFPELVTWLPKILTK